MFNVHVSMHSVHYYKQIYNGFQIEYASWQPPIPRMVRVLVTALVAAGQHVVKPEELEAAVMAGNFMGGFSSHF